MTTARAPWWKGKRGEWYVIAQVVLIATVFFAPRNVSSLPEWRFPELFLILGAVLILAGGALFVAGIASLREALTPLPYPRSEGEFVDRGPYRFVRHPIYSGGIAGAFGWALMVRGWLTLLYCVVLLIFFEVKARREERWLVEKYPEYARYQKRVPRLIPFIRWKD